ncbi:hypothetical protein [Actinomadura sp. 9N407]|uniref:hypothetical protein n=1 Tax=Actinomadura sp. 9N407 TaxID=3375154 RepID=UPI00379CAB83
MSSLLAASTRVSALRLVTIDTFARTTALGVVQLNLSELRSAHPGSTASTGTDTLNRGTVRPVRYLPHRTAP